MLEPSIRLYGTANAVVYIAFALMLFPEGLALGIFAFIFSSLLSLPVLLALCVFFGLIKRFSPGVIASWILLVLFVGFCAVLPFLVFGLYNDSLFGDQIFQLLGVGSAYLALLIQLPYIAKLFNNIHQKNEDSYENN